MNSQANAVKLATLETKMDDVLEIVKGLKVIPIECAKRGVQLDTLVDAHVEKRLSKLEHKSKVITWVGSTIITMAIFLSRNALWQSIQQTFK